MLMHAVCCVLRTCVVVRAVPLPCGLSSWSAWGHLAACLLVQLQLPKGPRHGASRSRMGGVVWCAESAVTKWQWPGCVAYR